MRYALTRVLAGGVLFLTLSGCGLVGGNKGQVCEETKEVFEGYMAQVRKAPAADPAPWKQATEQLAGRLDGLARKADDDELKKALSRQAAAFRQAAAGVGAGDVSRFDRALSTTPAEIGRACA